MKERNMKPIVDLMDKSINKLQSLIDAKHKMDCNVCGQEIDMRDLSQVFAHEPCEGVVNYETMEKIPNSGATRIGEPIIYTKTNRKINLN